MSADWLHGSETIQIENGARPVKTVKSAVIGLIGIAPMGPVNQATLVTSETKAAQFGAEKAGFTIPQALRAIYDHGAGTVIVINVLDPDKHKASVSDEAVAFSATTQSVQLKHPLVSSVIVKNNDSNTTYVQNQDYVLEPQSGMLTRKSGGSIGVSDSLKVSYSWTDPSKVTSADIIGGIDAAGKRIGMKLLADSYSLFGFDAKILIAPVFCTQNSVTTELVAMAEKMGAMSYIDAPVGTTFEQVITGRGPAGTINFNTASRRVRLCYPHVLVYDKETNSNRLEPLSSRAAGLRAKVDLDKGFWWSSSNQAIQGIVGLERPLTARIDDASSEVNQLNEKGITTVFNSYGTGFLLWGNRSAAFPTDTSMKGFECVLRTGDMVDESLRFFSQQFMDRPIDQALIDALTDSVNGYGRKLIGDGAVLGFKCWFDPARNDKTELANGHLLLSYKFTPPPPMERLTLESEITSEYLLTLKSGGNS